MDRNALYEKLKDIIRVTLKGEVKIDSITETTNLPTELGISSIQSIEILVRLEKVFDIEVDDEDLSGDFTKDLATLADYVEKQILLQHHGSPPKGELL